MKSLINPQALYSIYGEIPNLVGSELVKITLNQMKVVRRHGTREVLTAYPVLTP